MSDELKQLVDEAQKIKLGEQEFDPSELEDLVSKGKLVNEVETKYNTKIDRVFPEYTKATQELKELRTQADELKQLKEQMARQTDPGSQFTPDQIEQARKQLETILGGRVITEKDWETRLNERDQLKEATRIVESDIKDVLADIKKSGKPEATREELLQYMNDTGIVKAESAYKQMKEAELDDWKMKQLQSGKRLGLHTITTSSPGSKEPAPVRPTLQNLQQLTHEALYGNSGEEE